MIFTITFTTKKLNALFLLCLSFLFLTAADTSDSPQFVTLDSMNETFPVHGKIKKVSQYESVDAAPLSIKESNFWSELRFNEPGFYGISVLEQNGNTRFYSVFVSPIPSVHTDRRIEDTNWYQTQFNSGTLSNCGPACCSMAISFATGEFFPVSEVRREVGWQGDGGTSFEELIKVIKSQNINAKIIPLKTFEQIKNVIDSNGVAIVLFKTDGVASNSKNPGKNFFDKYYVDNVGHYILVKGYSEDGRYLIVHDPIPSDWSGNNFRHSDGISMIGKNRYYKTDELLKSLRRQDMIAVMRN